jgi:hypothetical protein
LGRAELERGSAAMSHLQMLMESLNSTDGGNETTANPADEGGDHAANETDTTGESGNSSTHSEESEEHAAAAAGSSEASGEQQSQDHSSNSEEQNAATGEHESQPAQTQAAANCGDPMSSTESFSCWLGKYKDPDDVEDFIKQHKDLSTDEWYDKAKQSTFSMSDWLEKHVSYAPACPCLKN